MSKVFVLFFEPNVKFTLNGNVESCTTSNLATSWCGYHGYAQTAGSNRYIVLPYLGNGGGAKGYCYQSCHFSNEMANYANVFTHELADTVTDPDLKNYRASNGNEVADICTTQYKNLTVPSPPGNCAGTTAAYYTQKLWSNSACACV